MGGLHCPGILPFRLDGDILTGCAGAGVGGAFLAASSACISAHIASALLSFSDFGAPCGETDLFFTCLGVRAGLVFPWCPDLLVPFLDGSAAPS